MSEFKGTKGKWQIKHDNVFKLNHNIKSIYNSTVCTVHTKNCTKSEEGKANALLISKAPEMLESLKEVVSYLEAIHGCEDTECLELKKAREIIKQSTEI